MESQELVNALRCALTAGGPMGDCEKFPLYKTEPVPEELAETTHWPIRGPVTDAGEGICDGCC